MNASLRHNGRTHEATPTNRGEITTPTLSFLIYTSLPPWTTRHGWQILRKFPFLFFKIVGIRRGM